MPHRDELTPDQFAKIAHMLPGREGHVGVRAKDNHNFLNAVFWIMKTGAPWRDLPERYGNWQNVHRRFTRWAKRGIFDKILQGLTDGEESELLLLDSTVVRAHQHAAGAKKSKAASEALGRSSGGWSSKIHCAVKGQGVPASLYLSEGQVHDSQYGPLLLENQRSKYVLGDRAYAGQKLLAHIASIGAEAVIPPHQRSKESRSYNRAIYKERNKIERFFNRIKHFRGIATRYCKRAAYFLEAVKWAACIILLIN